jgi:hypothetical protein
VLASFSLSTQERYMQDLNTLLLLRNTTTAATTMLPISMMRLVINYRRYVNLLKEAILKRTRKGPNASSLTTITLIRAKFTQRRYLIH